MLLVLDYLCLIPAFKVSLSFWQHTKHPEMAPSLTPMLFKAPLINILLLTLSQMTMFTALFQQQ